MTIKLKINSFVFEKLFATTYNKFETYTGDDKIFGAGLVILQDQASSASRSSSGDTEFS